MLQDGARGQNLGHLKKSLFCFAFIFLMKSFKFKEQVLFRADFLPVTSDCRPFFAFLILSFAESFIVEQQALFGVDFIHISMISDVKVQCLSRGVRAGLEV